MLEQGDVAEFHSLVVEAIDEAARALDARIADQRATIEDERDALQRRAFGASSSSSRDADTAAFVGGGRARRLLVRAAVAGAAADVAFAVLFAAVALSHRGPAMVREEREG